MVWKILNGMCAIKFDVLFNLAPATGTRGHPYKLASTHINVDARRRFFSQRVIRKWNSLSVATVMSEPLGRVQFVFGSRRRAEFSLVDETSRRVLAHSSVRCNQTIIFGIELAVKTKYFVKSLCLFTF